MDRRTVLALRERGYVLLSADRGAYRFVREEGMGDRKSALQGVIATLEAGFIPTKEAINELDALLGELRKAGWSGYMPANEILRILTEDAWKYRDLSR